jgi:hypothetical protein
MRILVGYDGSNVSKEAVKIAVRYAQAFQARIYVLMSMVGGPGCTPGGFCQKRAGAGLYPIHPDFPDCRIRSPSVCSGV